MSDVYVLSRTDLEMLLEEAFRQGQIAPSGHYAEYEQACVSSSLLGAALASTDWLAVPVKSVQLLHDRHGPDRISINLVDELAREIHGDAYPFWQGAHLDLQCAGDHGEQALSALGIKADETIEVGHGRARFT